MKTFYEILNSLGINASLIIGGVIGGLIGMKPGLVWWKQLISVLIAAFIANYTAPVIVDLFGMGQNTLAGVGFIAGYSGKTMLEYTMEKITKFLACLSKKENEMLSKLRFLREHNFNKEAEFIETKVKIISEIKLELQSIVDGRNETGDVRVFYFE